MAKRKKQDEEGPKDENFNSNDADDTFGLPDIEYQPIDREEEASSEPVQTEQEDQPVYSTDSSSEKEETTYRYTPPKEESSIVPRILGIILVLIIAAGAAYYFVYYKPEQDRKKEQDRIAAEAKAKADKLEKDRLAALESARIAAEQRRADSLANLSKEGSIEALTDRTGRYYVVVASAIDDDLISDYARKLSAKGVNTKIIPPFGKSKFYRISIADGESFASAQQTADGLKGEYGDAVWVLKY